LEKVESLGNRLQLLMEERSLNYDKLGRMLEMKPQTLNRYVLGQREPKARVATEMAMRLEVDPLWLQGYDVPRSAQSLQSAPAKEVAVLERWELTLPAHRQKAVRYLPWDVSDPENCFFLPVSDEGMAGAGIHRGDLVLYRRQSTARSGQMVLCSLNGLEPSLRRYFVQGSWMVFQSELSGTVPRLFPLSAGEGEVQILGVALTLVRELG
jgi:repressor LexA